MTQLDLPVKVKPRRLYDLETHDCRFPVGRRNEEYLFCAAPRRDALTSFCAEHHKVVWVKQSKEKRRRRGRPLNALGLRSPMRD